MTPRFQILPDAARDAETRAVNSLLLRIAQETPGLLLRPPADIRAEHRAGVGYFDAPVYSEQARNMRAEAIGLSVPVRVMEPINGCSTGVFLYIHGGGWSLGACDLQDPLLERIADETGLVCVSVDYRLAPENPYPAGPDDCEAAALWLARNTDREFGTKRLFIGGDSAGAHFSTTTLLRLRDRHGQMPFSGACLFYGLYDMGLTPSMRTYADLPLLDRVDVENFRAHFLQNGEDTSDPDISPLHADLTGMPPAFFTCGTRDGLVDDTLFMASRWAAAGNEADVVLWPEGPHNFLVMDIALARQSLAHAIEWLNKRNRPT